MNSCVCGGKEKILVLVKVTIGVCTAATLYALGSYDLF